VGVHAANVEKMVVASGKLRAEALRAKQANGQAVRDLTRDRDQLLRCITDMQRTAGLGELADSTEALKVAYEKIAKLEKWKEERLFIVASAENEGTTKEAQNGMAEAHKNDVGGRHAKFNLTE
jgi:hypothetical protein